LKKLAALLLLSIFIFNWIGYRFVVNYLQHKADIRLEARLDNKYYDESHLIELKVPINLPYQTSWASYERYDGEIELDGKLYKYVERKVADDTLYLKCLPNAEKMHLEDAKDNFFLNVNDLAQNDHNQQDQSKTSVFKKLIGDFTEHDDPFTINAIALAGQHFGISTTPAISSVPTSNPDLPPENIVA
jgi:hypothetical protein